MRGPFDLQDGVRDRLAAARELFLELGLEVDVPLDGVVDPLGEGVDDGLADGLEAMLEVESSQARLDERRQDVPIRREAPRLGLGLRRMLRETLAELQLAADDGAAVARDDVGPDLRQPAFLIAGEALVELAGDRQPKDAVAEELEPLVGLRAVFRPRRVRECAAEPLLGKLVDQAAEVGPGLVALRAGGSRCSRWPARRSGSAGRPRPRS